MVPMRCRSPLTGLESWFVADKLPAPYNLSREHVQWPTQHPGPEYSPFVRGFGVRPATTLMENLAFPMNSCDTRYSLNCMSRYGGCSRYAVRLFPDKSIYFFMYRIAQGFLTMSRYEDDALFVLILACEGCV